MCLAKLYLISKTVIIIDYYVTEIVFLNFSKTGSKSNYNC